MDRFKKITFIILFPWFLLSQENWIYRYNGITHSDDKAYSIVADTNGNIYVTGFLWNKHLDLSVVSLSPDGQERWVYKYSNSNTGPDEGRYITYGDDGNLYVTGYSIGNISSRDIVVISLTPDGQERWVYRYNGPANLHDEGYFIIYGDDGNLYVTGYSESENTDRDLVVISLTTNGQERWVYRYDYSSDEGYSIAFGDSSVYVLGYSKFYGTVVIGLSTYGQEKWFFVDTNCIPFYWGFNNYNKILYGQDGNLYISATDLASDDIPVVISLTNNGELRWVYKFTGQGGFNFLTFDDNQNLYAVGSSDYKLLVVKLNNNGNEIWKYQYPNSGGALDVALSAIYGNDGYLYIAGLSYSYGYTDFLIISLTTYGQERWSYIYNGSGDKNDEAYSLVYGKDGNIYIAGYSYGYYTHSDFTVISLQSTTGEERWIYEKDGFSNSKDMVYCMVYGDDDNLYIAGFSEDDTIPGLYGKREKRTDLMVMSLTPEGLERWSYGYNDSNYYNEAYSIAYGGDGNLYVAGYSENVCIYYGYFTVMSLTPDGQERWVYRYNGSGVWSMNKAYSVIYGLDGNIYVSGYSEGNGTDKDFTVISLTTDGQERWVYKYNGPDNGEDIANSIVYGNDGKLYIAGYSEDNLTGRDLIVISLNTDGHQRWVYRYNGPGNQLDEAYSIVYGSDGNLYVAGYSVGEGTYEDFVVISLTTDGQERWVYRYNGPGSQLDEAHSIIYGNDGNLYVAGYSTGIGSHEDFTVISLTPDGQERWIYRYNGIDNEEDIAYSIVYGSDGNIYISGCSRGDISGNDFLVVSLAPDGQERWVYRYNGSGNYMDQAFSIVYGNDGKIYAAGTSFETGTGFDATVISLPALSVNESNLSDNDIKFFTPLFFDNKILLNLPYHKGSVEICIYNSAGMRIYKKVVKPEKYIVLKDEKIESLKKGIYFLKIQTEGKKIFSSKIIKR